MSESVAQAAAGSTPPPSSLVRLAAASARIHSAPTLSDLLHCIAEEARALIGAHQAVTSLTDPESGLQAVSTVSMSQKYAAWASYDEAPDGTGIYTIPCMSNRAIRLSQAALEAHPAWRGFGAAKDRHPPIRGWLAAPFVGRDGANLGLVQLSDRLEGDFTEDDEAILVQLAAMTAVAIENIRLLERVKASEAEARTAQHRLLDAIDALPDAFAVYDADDRIVIANSKFRTFRPQSTDQGGISFEELMRRTAAQVLHDSMMPDGLDAWMDWRRERHRNPSGPFEQRYRDDRWAMIWESRTRDGQTVFIRADITALKEAQGQAQEARRQVEQILAAITDILFAIDGDGAIVFANAAACSWLGIPEAEAVGAVVWALPASPLGGEQRGRCLAAMATQEAASFTLDGGDGRRLTIRLFPGARHLVVLGHDETPLLKTLSALEESDTARLRAERFNRTILEASPDVVCLIDAGGCYVEMSPRCREILGYDRRELIGRRYLDFSHPDDVEALLEAREAVRLRHELRTFEVRHRHKDGHYVPMHWAAVLSPNDELSVAIGRDMTEQKRLAERIRQVERLEAVGQLTGGVAHDFNNLLTIILGNAEFLASRLPEQPRLQALASMMQQAAERGADLTGRLLAFAQQQPIEPRAVDINALITDMLPLLKRTIGGHIEIDLALSAEAGTALTDPAQLQTAIANLCLNARDAMPTGGRIGIETTTIELGPGPAGEAAGRHVAITVADSGSGMPAAVLARAFEPFFTTKEVGKGTGLGLSMVYGFAHQNGGRVEIDSSPGLGTLVRLHLPASVPDRAAAGAQADAEHPRSLSGTRVLLVEDDPLVRTHVAGLLAELGLDVTLAETGKAALGLLRRGQKFDLLFTDIVMPGGMTGFETAAAASALVPGLKVLLTSGYPDKAAIPGGGGTTLPMLKKPYRRQQLAEAIRKALGT